MEDLSKLLDPTQATTDAEFEEAWERCLRPKQARVPRVGTVTERSSNKPSKIEPLLQAPPRPPPHKKKTVTQQKEKELQELFGDLSDLSDDEAASMTTDTPPTEYGPAGPPPVRVKINGHELLIPYFAATIGRKYRARIGDQKLLLRFNNAGECTFVRKL